LKVTALLKQLKRADRINVYIDQRYAFSMSVTQIADFGIHQDVQVSPEQIKSWRRASKEYLLFQRVESWALRRHHSRREIEQYLARILKTDIDRRNALRYLKQHGYIDEWRFAQFWVEHRHRSQASNLRIKAELSSKGIDRPTIESVLPDDVELPTIRRLIAKKSHSPQYADRQKLMAYLARKGFNYCEIKEALDSENDSTDVKR